ncbi:hypothetical protein [Sinorhizobium medicae]|uniref:hypothetical protein n=1 Tax=Sinorhizobium medicae TaxID=110321 RepID=UPI000FD71ECB|nr:hypothetical protein [Sinorhizobium medicae]RVO68495.1 hypothetical protein CN084_32975 [Sinorhizobium medicae]
MMRSYFLSFTVTLMGATSVVHAQSALVDPGWEDPAFSAYVERARSRSAIGERSIAEEVVRGAFSLPVLGLAEVEGQASDRSGLGGTRFDPAAFAADIPDWPECAADVPAIVTVPEDPAGTPGSPPGSWYMRNFDFGCVHLSIEGDRTALPSENASREFGESGTITVSSFDENAGEAMDAEGRSTVLQDTPGIVTPASASVAIKLGNLVFGLEVECLAPEAYALCRNVAALTVLGQKLQVVGGQPDL